MRAWARHPSDRPSKRRIPKRQRITRTAPPPPPAPPAPPANPNTHYEAAWTERGVRQLVRCHHYHATLIEAAQCAMPNGAGWYVFAVEDDEPRELREAEEEIVNRYRFGR
jgi:hypothetical protein